MAALTAQQLKELSRLLDERERFLTEDVRREVNNREEYVQIAGEVPDPGDQATADMMRDLNHAEVGRDVAELREIEAARRRMQDDEYGLCPDCGSDIPFERLQVQPAAPRCVPCQSVREKTYAREGASASL